MPASAPSPRDRQHAARQLLAACRRLVELRLVTGTVGNASVRLGDGVLITPSRTPYASMRPRDLVFIAPGDDRRRSGRPSRELPLHLTVYAQRPDAGAIVHTHSPYATAWSFLGRPLRPRVEELEYYGIGEILTTQPAAPGSLLLAAAAAEALSDARAVLLGGHGVLTLGTDLEHALAIAEAVEHQAQIAWLLHSSPQERIADDEWPGSRERLLSRGGHGLRHGDLPALLS